MGIAALIAVIAIFIMQEPVPEQVHNAFNQGRKSALTPPGTQDPFSDQFVRELQRYYGRTISSKATQASLYDLWNSIMGSRPDKGRELFYGILKRAFPGHVDAIMATLDKIDQYKQWIEDNKAALSRMSETERLAVLQKKRFELFGEDARQIWTGEELATEARRAKMQDTLAVLNESHDTTMDEKIEVYREALRETYQGTPEGFILDQGPLLSKVFFSIDSVQDELKQMNPQDRQQEINRIRREMGFTEKQVESMARRDADNELRWEAGLQYMQDREAAVQQYDGARLEEKLGELREQYFDDEADTIAREEKDGFFRFKRPHIYGRN
ncbi:MAG TPA: hypothetical protein PLR71_13245 [Deltaproteobacteria bacterium]|nr:hypothetical protein [Deltaproteobacteria bacterium]